MMWPWGSWSFKQGRDEEEEETKEQANMAERQRQPSGVGYYQRSKAEELSTKPCETTGTDKGKEEAVTLRMQLATQKSEQDVLQTEATVRQFETDLDLSKATVAKLQGEITKLEDGMTKMQAALSESEHHRQGLSQELAKVKEQRDTLDQKYLSVLALNENSKSQASQVDCVMNENTQVKHEASKWKEMMSAQSAELSNLRGVVGALRKENDDLKGEIEAQKAQAQVYMEDFESEQRKREVAHGKIADHQRKYAHDVGELKAQLAQMEEHLAHHQDRLAEVEQVNQRREKEMRSLLEEASKNQQEVQAKTSQVKQYKKQVDSLKEQVAELTKHNEELIQEMDRVRTELDELAPYKIESFSKLEAGASKGSGSFGSIQLIEVNGIPCIAKRLHDILVGRGQTEVVEKVQKQSIEEKFHKECVFLSRLRHPNIVQFMGVHYSQDPSNLTLIMECLPMDLERCLEQYPNIPLPIKISILLDVSYGLLHLHSQKPPIIHRDLTAANILLTSDMKAKIADLGVSKILDLHPLHGTLQTVGPGALAYMPPEALKRAPSYGTKLDDFSFGVIMLYVVNQEFPMAEDRSTPEAVQKQETHIEKRRDWVDQVGKSHPLYELITACLQDVPDRRPSTSEINNSLKQLSKRHPRRFQDIMEMNQHLRRLEKRISASSELQSQASMLKKIVEED